MYRTYKNSAATKLILPVTCIQRYSINNIEHS